MPRASSKKRKQSSITKYFKSKKPKLSITFTKPSSAKKKRVAIFDPPTQQEIKVGDFSYEELYREEIREGRVCKNSVYAVTNFKLQTEERVTFTGTNFPNT